MAGKQEVNDSKNFRGRRVRRIEGVLTLTVGLLFTPSANVQRISIGIRAHLQ